MFGQLGGMDSILTMISSFFIGVFSSKIYTSSLLSSLYYISKEKSFKITPKIKREENN